MSAETTFEETAVCAEAAVAEGDSKLVWIGKLRLLICRSQGRISAVQPLCPHYQMPLSDGLVCGGVIQCSWHQSRFDLDGGALLDPPALSPIRTYPTRVTGGWIYVTPTPNAPPKPPVPPVVSASAGRGGEGSSIILLGGGAAGHAAALRLRELGFAGRVVQIIGEPHAPYDRPNLSKEHLSGSASPGDLPLPSAAGVVRIHRKAIGIDPAEQLVRFEDRSLLRYDRLLLAPGSVPVKPEVPGSHLPNVLTLRSRADGERLLAVARPGRRVVVVGSSFIGMEVAAAMRERGLRVVVVTTESSPFAKAFGEEVGGYFRELHERRGVRFRFRSKVASFTGRWRVEGVMLDTGEHLPADIVVAGIGVRPATDWLPAEWKDADGRLPVDDHLAVTAAAGRVFAAGDVAAYPDPLTGEPTHVEHWRVAEQQGRLAAANLLATLAGGRTEPFRAVPYFWSYQLGQGLDYVGHAQTWDEVIVDGEITAGDFVAYYRKGDEIHAAASVGRSLQTAALLEWMTRHGRPTAQQVRARPDWVAMIRSDC